MSAGSGAVRTVTYTCAAAEVGRADPLAVLVGEHQREGGEEPAGVHDGQREAGVFQRVQPAKARAGVAVEQRVAQPAEADQPERELEHVRVGDLQRAEAGALEWWRSGHEASAWRRRRSVRLSKGA